LTGGDQEPDDALPRDQRALVAELTDRGMPDLVEELLTSAPTMHRIYVARAYAEAAIKSKEGEVRARFLEKAAANYRRLVALGKDSSWLRGLRRGFDVADWQVEWADLLLRYQAAPDLDRYEVTSGLDFDRPRLVKLLREAHREYGEAQARLDEMIVGLRTQEQRYLLLGLADKITRLADRRRLNAAWADVYLAMVDGEGDRGGSPNSGNPACRARRQALLDSALADFDAISRTALHSGLPDKDAELKYNALVGAGIVLRESGRNAEAMSAFDRVRLSTASPALMVRARYEQARTHLVARQFDEARRELGELERMQTSGPDEASGFYVRLAPIIMAYSYMEESKDAGRGPTKQTELREKAVGAFNEIADRGSPWAEIAQVYLAALQGPDRKLEELGDAELSLTASRWMKAEQYDKAIAPLKLLLNRSTDKTGRAEAAFNLAVCRFQTGDLPSAVEGFEAVAKAPLSGELAERAASYAYQCWRRIADAEKTTAHYERLAQAASRLADRFSTNENAEEARWIAALAYQEAAQLPSATQAYSKIPPTSSHHRAALRGIAICRQRLYEQLPPDAPRDRRRQAARAAADSWKQLAAEFSAESSTQPSREAESRTDANQLVKMLEEASLSAATLLASEDLAAFDEALGILRSMPQGDRVVVLRLRCLRAAGDEKRAREEFDKLLKDAPESQRGRILSALADQLDNEAQRLESVGRLEDAKKSWVESVHVLDDLLEWSRTQEDGHKQIVAIRSNLARLLARSGDPEAARVEYDKLISSDPTNGGHLRNAALLEEELARRTNPPDSAAADRAEAHWAKLLKDGNLRERSPSIYWEARYYWLSHQLRHGRAPEVWKGVESEKAWYPDLGGPPWQGRLIELAQKAHDAGGAETPR